MFGHLCITDKTLAHINFHMMKSYNQTLLCFLYFCVFTFLAICKHFIFFIFIQINYQIICKYCCLFHYRMGSQNDLPSQNHMRTGRWHLHATPHATSMKEWSALTHLGLLFGAGSIAFLMLQREVEILLTCPPLKKRQASLLLKGWEENFRLDFNFLSLKARRLTAL